MMDQLSTYHLRLLRDCINENNCNFINPVEHPMYSHLFKKEPNHYGNKTLCFVDDDLYVPPSSNMEKSVAITNYLDCFFRNFNSSVQLLLISIYTERYILTSNRDCDSSQIINIMDVQLANNFYYNSHIKDYANFEIHYMGKIQIIKYSGLFYFSPEISTEPSSDLIEENKEEEEEEEGGGDIEMIRTTNINKENKKRKRNYAKKRRFRVRHVKH